MKIERQTAGVSIHPSQKLIGLYTRPILNHTDVGDVVYDPFAGSGLIFATAQETGRIALGVEIEPHFCGSIIERLKEQYSLRAKIVGNVFDCKIPLGPVKNS